MAEMISQLFGRQDNLVPESIAFFRASMPFQVSVVDPSDMFCFMHRSSTIKTGGKV